MQTSRGRQWLVESSDVLLRSVAMGACAGACIGGVLGTAIAPALGTAIGGFYGGVIGGGFGAVNGMALVGVRRLSPSCWAASITGAVMSFGCAVALITVIIPFFASLPGPMNDAFLVICPIIGAVLAPEASQASRRPFISTDPDQRTASQVVGGALAFCGFVCVGFGACAGLGIGLYAHPATAPFAILEGATFGAIGSVVLAMPVAAALLLPRLRLHR
jgi:hypothetical protein